MFFEMLAGRTPFHHRDDDSHFAVYLRVMKGRVKWPRGISSDAKALIKAMLTPDLAKRLHGADAVRKHKLFKGVEWDSVEQKQLLPPFVPDVQHVADSHYFSEVKKDDPHLKPKKGKTDDFDSSILNSF